MICKTEIIEITWEPNPQSVPTLRLKGRLDADGAQLLREEAHEKKYCIDILNQVSAVKGALGAVEKRILERHFQH